MTAQQELETEWLAQQDYLCELSAEHADPYWDCEPDFDQSDIIIGTNAIDLEKDLPF